MIFAIVMELIQSKIECKQQARAGSKFEKLDRVKHDRAKFRLMAQTFARFTNDKEEIKEMKEAWLKELEELLPISRDDGLTAQSLLACILEMPRAELVTQLDRICDYINRFMDNQIDEELVPQLPYFFSEICRIASDRGPAAQICSGGSMEADFVSREHAPGPI